MSCLARNSGGFFTSRNGLVAVFLIIAALVIGSNGLNAATSIDIPPGDTEAFLQAVRLANDSEETVLIGLAGRSLYQFQLPGQAPPIILGDLVIEGNNAEFVGSGLPGFAQLFSVAAGGNLTLSQLVVHSFDSGSAIEVEDRKGLIFIEFGGRFNGKDLRFENITVDLRDRADGALFTNYGELSLDRVRIRNIKSGPALAIAVYNFGSTFLRNVLVADSRFIETGPSDVAGIHVLTDAVGLNLVVEYSTFIARSDLVPADEIIFPVQTGGGIAVKQATVAGSLFIGTRCPDATSLDFNLMTDDCAPGAGHDLVATSAEPLLIAYDDGLVVIPQKGSKALDGGHFQASKCPPEDAISTRRPQDGKGNGKARCDIGAFEAREQAPLFDGGENGLYYDAGHDGHFVSVQEVRPNEYVISWNAFDLDGNQSWVIAIGAREGDTITADTWFLPEGRLLPGGSADVDTSALQEWGTISIRLLDCQSGAFTYQSSLPQFGSGSFPLDRLAGIFGLGCRAP